MGIWPAKRIARVAKPAYRKAIFTDDSDNAGDTVRSKGKVKTLQSAVG